MNAMAPTRPTELQVCRVRLTTSPAAAGEARGQVRAAIRAWDIPVEEDIAVLLTSELVTNAVTHGTPTAGTFVLLTIACDTACLRVDVHDGSGDLPVLDTGLIDESLAEAETGRGLLLVTSLSAEWGFYRTPAGKAVYFTLQLQWDDPETDIDAGSGPPDGRRSRSVS